MGNNLLTQIPENLFDGVYGVPGRWIFAATFKNCTGLKSIPEKLFAGLQGPPIRSMFSYTFTGCVGLTSVPENLFAGIDDTAPAADNMFLATFMGCSNLTGKTARINGRYLYDIWPSFNIVDDPISSGATYAGAGQLSDYADMPDFWK